MFWCCLTSSIIRSIAYFPSYRWSQIYSQYFNFILYSKIIIAASILKFWSSTSIILCFPLCSASFWSLLFKMSLEIFSCFWRHKSCSLCSIYIWLKSEKSFSEESYHSWITYLAAPELDETESSREFSLFWSLNVN